jgi:hypothetical protein
MTPASEEGFKVTDRRRQDPGEGPSPPRPPQTQRAQPEERNLSSLFMMLASEALIALGEAPDPVSGQRQPELPHAASVIDLLVLLREKTEGHRSSDETQVLEDLIYDLQLRYVRATKSSG